MTAEHDVLMANLSICPSHSGIVSNWQGQFLSATSVTKFQGNSLSGDIKYTVLEKIVILNRNHHLSRKVYEIGPWLLWTTNRKS